MAEGSDQRSEGDGSVQLAAGSLLTFLGLSAVTGVGAFLAFGAVFGAIFPLVFGLPFQDMALDDHAATCRGQLVEVRHDPNLRINDEDTYVVGFACKGIGDGPWDTRVQASSPLAQRHVGDRVTVEYLPEDESVARIRGNLVALSGWVGATGLAVMVFGGVALVLTLIVSGVGLVLLVSGLITRWRWARLYA